MRLRVERIILNENNTIGQLFVDGEYFCDTIEDTVRDINRNGVFDNGEVKIPDKTAIPYGTYKVTMNVKSPKYSNFTRYPYAEKYDGYMPRLLEVNGFTGVLIHPGNDENSSSGCLIIGEYNGAGKVLKSQTTFKRLMDERLMQAKERNEEITIEIA